MSIFDKSKPTLTYFDLYGRGEAIRMALVHSKTDFEDNRVSGESFAAFKASGKCLNGQLPVLEVDGRCLNQSEAIIRFVGSQTGAYDTSDPFAMWAADAVINTCSDLEKNSPKDADGKPLLYKMFGDGPMAEADVAAMKEARGKYWTTLQALLGDKAFFGGAKCGDLNLILDHWATSLSRVRFSAPTSPRTRRVLCSTWCICWPGAESVLVTRWCGRFGAHCRPSIGDFWVSASLHAMERNTKGKEAMANVYAAHAEALAGNAVMTAWADRISAEFTEYLATRGGGTL